VKDINNSINISFTELNKIEKTHFLKTCHSSKWCKKQKALILFDIVCSLQGLCRVDLNGKTFKEVFLTDQAFSHVLC
jgi:hypothetical protein